MMRRWPDAYLMLMDVRANDGTRTHEWRDHNPLP